MFFVVERGEKGKNKMITGISGFGFFWSKNGHFVTHICFSKKTVLKPHISIVFLGARFLAKLSKRGNFGHPPNTKEKFHWEPKSFFFVWYFCFFLFFCSCFSCFCFLFFVFFAFFCVFVFGGFKGQVRWPEGPPHLALNPPYLFFVFALFLLFWRV